MPGPLVVSLAALVPLACAGTAARANASPATAAATLGLALERAIPSTALQAQYGTSRRVARRTSRRVARRN